MIVDIRWAVVEITPGQYDGEYDTVWPDRSRKVFVGYSLDQVEEWLENNEPDFKGDYFEVYEEELRETVVRTWRYGRKLKDVGRP